MIKEINALETISLFVDDLPQSRRFYAAVFTHTEVYQDESCWIMKLGGVMINLLRASAADEVIAPLTPGGNHGPRALLTVKVNNVDSVCAELTRLGVPLLNGPIDRPWGRRTAAFADPDGNVWEIAQDLQKG
jgi:lactoylglutathione lyase